MKTSTNTTERLTISAVMLAIAIVLAVVCMFIPFLNLPFGGGFTIASMLPIVLISYMFGIKWGFFSSFAYAIIQILMDLATGGQSVVRSLLLPTSDDFMGYTAGIWILLLDYIFAYTVLGIGGIFRKMKNKTMAIAFGVVLALSLRYVFHIISGAIFYGEWAEWFFTQEGFYKIGSSILNTFSGKGLAIIYSVFYNGLYMIPEIIITTIVSIVVARIPQIRIRNSQV